MAAELPVPRGKLLGGSSSINGMVFVRGQAQDFDTRAQMGNRGWSYAEVLPFFKRMESYAGAINSPQLLELSGIGQPERLRNLGIEVRHALPGVGENLRDRYCRAPAG